MTALNNRAVALLKLGSVAKGQGDAPGGAKRLEEALASVEKAIDVAAKRDGPERLEAACTRAVAVRARSYRHVESILKRGLDRVAPPAQGAQAAPHASALHENVRGADYYQSTPHEGVDHAERTDDGEAAGPAPQCHGSGLERAAAKPGQQQSLL